MMSFNIHYSLYRALICIRELKREKAFLYKKALCVVAAFLSWFFFYFILFIPNKIIMFF